MQDERRRRRTWVHLVPVVLAPLSLCLVPGAVATQTLRIADASVELRPAAPFGAAVDGFLAAVSCTLLSSLVVMLTYWFFLRGRDETTRRLQLVGVVTTAFLALAGLFFGALLVANYVSYGNA